MASSNWNLYVDRVNAAPLTVNEYRLANAIARYTLGWRRNEAAVGERLLQDHAHLHDRRTFLRARDGLVKAGLLHFTPGERGRGRRARYELLLTEEKRAPTRAFPDAVKARNPYTKKRAPARARSGSGKGKNSDAPSKTEKPATSGNPELLRQAFDAYLGHGGSGLARDRDVLARQVTLLVNAGCAPRDILAACRELGTAREFPGYLKQRAEALARDGGCCLHDRREGRKLTVAQLEECGCSWCAEWASHHREQAAAAP